MVLLCPRRGPPLPTEEPHSLTESLLCLQIPSYDHKGTSLIYGGILQLQKDLCIQRGLLYLQRGLPYLTYRGPPMPTEGLRYLQGPPTSTEGPLMLTVDPSVLQMPPIPRKGASYTQERGLLYLRKRTLIGTHRGSLLYLR